MSGRIQDLLEQANYSEANDTSVTFAKRAFLAETEAKDYFEEIKQKLFDLNNWDEKSIADFSLYDENGSKNKDDLMSVGKFIRIDVPASGKDDWVKVIDIYDTSDEFAITVSPTYNPTEKPVNKEVTSHFFKDEARNNFCLQRNEKEVILYVIGISEKANIQETGGVIESVRNAATANLGYYLGAQKAMWKHFCTNFLEIGESEKAS